MHGNLMRQRVLMRRAARRRVEFHNRFAERIIRNFRNRCRNFQQQHRVSKCICSDALQAIRQFQRCQSNIAVECLCANAAHTLRDGKRLYPRGLRKHPLRDFRQ